MRAIKFAWYCSLFLLVFSSTNAAIPNFSIHSIQALLTDTSVLHDQAAAFKNGHMPARRGQVTLLEQRYLRQKAQTDDAPLAGAALHLGIALLQINEPARALKILNEAKAHFNEQQHFNASAVTSLALAIAHSDLDQHNAVQPLIGAALNSFQNEKCFKGIAIANFLLASYYINNNDWAKAESVLINNAIQLANFKLSKMAADAFMHLASLYIIKNKFSTADEFINKAINEALLANDSTFIALAYRNKAILLVKRSELVTAIDYLQRSLQFESSIEVLRLAANICMQIAQNVNGKYSRKDVEKFKLLNQQYLSRIATSANATKPSPATSSRNLRQDRWWLLLYSNQTLAAEDVEALQLNYNQQINFANDSIQQLNSSIEQDLVSDAAREDKIRQLEKDRALQELALSQQALKDEQQKRTINLLLTIASVVVITLVFLYNRYSFRKKSLQKLTDAYSQLNIAHKSLKQTQEQLIQAEKMASLGQLTAGIAHEIQNPLNFVNNFSTLNVALLHELDQQVLSNEQQELINTVTDNFTKIAHHGKRAQEIVRGMLLHSRVSKPDKQLSDVNLLIKENCELALGAAKAKYADFNATVEYELDESLNQIMLAHQDFCRVILNIVSNALYAVKLKVKLGNTEYQPKVIVATKNETGLLKITIRDNGVGMDAATLDKIFNPFFTTKPAGDGTGLGLSLSYNIIVKDHAGKLTVASEPNQYTEFNISIPTTQT